MVSPIEQMILTLQEAGFPLLLIWMLTIAIVYGILSHVNIPKSYSVRAVISIVSGFLVLFAAAASSIPLVIQNIISSLIVFGFVFLLVVVFLELLGIKSGELLGKYSPIILIIVAFVVFMIFLGSGAAAILPIRLTLSETAVSILLFIIIMALAMWILVREEQGKS
jgi:hypothetical protein